MRARARTTSLAAIGLMFGLALAATTAVAPASAAKPGPVGGTTAEHSCGYFAGLTVTADNVSVNSIGLKAGEVIGVTVSPARDGDWIVLSGGGSGSIFFDDAPATEGLDFSAPAGGTYNLGWSLDASGDRPSSLTWSFTCSTGGSTGGTTDADRDGVSDAADVCATTILPDAVKRPVAGRYYAQSSGRFVDGTGVSAGYTVIDTGGCSAAQIAKALGLRKGDSQSGISLTTLRNWAAAH